ncbi:glycosyl transferase [Acrocarpospora pleiomorpha]|uniref:Glycosyl transferase n=1 Tax=Acrocarpospora pleiomorpha TaxID=90975 RepID=A0A5M3XXI0_9ACTN|nr:polysaccharide deacetylase family protein [Acrocarpospora pleiomorpha]GES25865.1 glycosyl transferase [Acrocarpospora pleiomorpha]
MARVGTVTNLTVHGIGPTERELDPGEDATWVSIEQFELVLDAVVGRDDVRITFDDGNASDVAIALPRLLDRGLTAEFFVLAGLLGRPGRLTEDDVSRLVTAGMRISSHGWAHRDWRRIDDRQAEEELAQAHHRLAELTGQPVSRVAIPFGSYDRHVLRRLRKAGVTRAYTSDGGRAAPGSWLQARTSLVCCLDADWTRQVLDETPSPVVRARKLTGRVVKRVRG